MRHALLPVLALLALPGCATITVGSDWDPAVDFGVLTTWDWTREPRRPTGDPRIDRNTLLDERVRGAVERELPARGFRREPSGRPDVVVAYHVVLDRKSEVRIVGDQWYLWPWAPGGGAFVATPAGPRPSLRDWDEFTLVVDVVEPETRRLLWRGYARDEATLDATPDERQARIDEMVRRMLLRFPQGGHR